MKLKDALVESVKNMTDEQLEEAATNISLEIAVIAREELEKRINKTN